MAKNLVSVMAFPVSDILKTDNKTKKYDDQVNFTQTRSKSKGVMVSLFHETNPEIMHLIADLQDIFKRTLEAVRPARRFFLQHKPVG